MLRVGYSGMLPREAPHYAAFEKRMTELGDQEGRNFRFEDKQVFAYMVLGVLLTVLFVALSVAAPRTAEGLLPEYKPWDFPPELDLGEWSSGVFTIHRTQQKEQPRLYWKVFRVAVVARTGPRKIVLTYDANTDRLTLNGKRCHRGKKQEL
jgi:hypothetical protein